MNNHNKKLDISTAQLLAILKNGKCLSEEYINIDSPLIWECKFGHVWKTSLYNIKNKNTWCPKCAGVAKYTMEDMKLFAEAKKGKCLSTTYNGVLKKLTWECEFGHQWRTVPSTIINKNTWCPKCVNKEKLTIEIMHEVAKKKNGKCLSNKYVNNETKLLWECEVAHRWEAIPTSVKNRNSWCPICANNIKLSLIEMKKLATENNGKCISSEYINMNSKLKWQCQHGHEWEAFPRDIKNGKWCPDCHRSKRMGENAVRKFFEEIFNNKFPSSRPIWLTYEGKKLELDGYCVELKIAFEYQGKYHFDENAYWYPNKSTSFERRQLLDAYKRQVCKDQEVKLIEIHELDPTKKTNLWKDYIKERLISNNIPIPSNFDSIQFGAREFYTSNNHTQEAHNIAKIKNGACHSENVLYRTQIVDWECSLGHRWSASLTQVSLRKTWCPRCAKRVRFTIMDMHKIAKLNKGRCLSNEYINLKTKLLWECHLLHRWEASPSSIKNNKIWCPICLDKN